MNIFLFFSVEFEEFEECLCYQLRKLLSSQTPFTPGIHEKVIQMTFSWKPGVKGLSLVYLFLI